MTMAIDQPSRHPLGSLEFGSMPYSSSPHFSNPWTSSSSSSGSAAYSNHPLSSSSNIASRASTMSMPYSSLPATTSSIGSSSYSAMPYHNPELLNQPSEIRPYDHAYSSAPNTTSSYAPTSSNYATANSFGHSLAPPPSEPSSRRISPPMSVSMPQQAQNFNDMDASRGIVPTSQADITPRNIYGPRGDRGSGDAYGFPNPHSASSSISSASGYPSYFGGASSSGHSVAGSVAGSVDGSVTDYSSASESVDGGNGNGLGSRTLPRPNALLNATAAASGLPPAPASMMSSFNSKVSSSTQKKHKCKVCDKRFTRPSSLQTHMYSHTGEKPFACEVPGCGRNFSVVSNLRRHRKVHKGDRSAEDLDHDHGSPEGSWASHE